MIALRVAGRLLRVDDLPLGLLDALEQECGCPLGEVAPGRDASHAAATARMLISHAGLDESLVGRVRLTDFESAEDDLPTLFVDGVPKGGGRATDVWIAQLCRPPFAFTPRQVRNEFSRRDVTLLVEAMRGMK